MENYDIIYGYVQQVIETDEDELMLYCNENFRTSEYEFLQSLENKLYEFSTEGAIICLILAILFQPFFKISLGREIWNIVDVIVGISLIVSLFVSPKIEKD